MTPAEAAKASRQARAFKAAAQAKRRALQADLAEGKALDVHTVRELAYSLGVRTLQLVTRDAVSLASDAGLSYPALKRVGEGIARELAEVAGADDLPAAVAALEAQHAAELAELDKMLA